MSKMINQISVIMGLSIIAATSVIVFGADPQSSFWLSLIVIGGAVMPSVNQTFRSHWVAPTGCHWFYLAAAAIGVLEFVPRINVSVANDIGALFAIAFTIISALYFLVGYFNASGIPKLETTGALLVFAWLVSLMLPVVEFDPIFAIPVYVGFFSVLVSTYKEKGFKNDRGH